MRADLFLLSKSLPFVGGFCLTKRVAKFLAIFIFIEYFSKKEEKWRKENFPMKCYMKW